MKYNEILNIHDNYYFKKLYPIYNKVVKYYQDDFLTHDRHSLCNYEGEFFWGCRETGTDLLLVDPIKSDFKRLFNLEDTFLIKRNHLKHLFSGEEFQFLNAEALRMDRNDVYYHGVLGNVYQIRYKLLEHFLHIYVDSHIETLRYVIKNDRDYRTEFINKYLVNNE